jgi:hypothetical protein
MEVGKPKCCEGLKFIAKSTGTKMISLPAKLLLHYCILRAPRGFPFLGQLRSRLGEDGLPWGRRSVEPDQQHHREAFFKGVV